MKQSFYTARLISAIFITLLLLYFMIITPSPKIIFMPFVICSIAMCVKYAALLLHMPHFARLCDRLFAAGFFIFWFGFLAVAGYISIRDNQLSMLLFSIPFWLAGFIFAKKRLFK
ncbi:MAG: hypothetical protein IIX62_01060 [Peptococcaceae bacterium]|jgi:hypothetical protein|nr:hypothetical protein [Peptococcaceae bacterium]